MPSQTKKGASRLSHACGLYNLVHPLLRVLKVSSFMFGLSVYVMENVCNIYVWFSVPCLVYVFQRSGNSQNKTHHSPFYSFAIIPYCYVCYL